MTKRNSTRASTPKQAKKHSTKRLNTEQFIAKAIAVHGDVYDYSMTRYTKSRVKVEIICKEHGVFWQTPNNHLRGKRCPSCHGTPRKTAEQFTADAKAIHGDRYCYKKSRYKRANEKIIITCKHHGDFEQLASSHLAGKGCPICAGRNKTTKQFIDECNVVHCHAYSYEKVVYRSAAGKVVITCQYHGDFEQSATNHLSGQGCPECSKYRAGFNKTTFRDRCKKNNRGLGRLYVIKCHQDDEVFYKVGITSLRIKARFRKPDDMPYQYDVLFLLEMPSDTVYDLEYRLHRLLNSNAYTPKIAFSGSKTECFETIKPVERLLKKLATTEQLQLLA